MSAGNVSDCEFSVVRIGDWELAEVQDHLRKAICAAIVVPLRCGSCKSLISCRLKVAREAIGDYVHVVPGIVLPPDRSCTLLTLNAYGDNSEKKKYEFCRDQREGILLGSHRLPLRIAYGLQEQG